MQASGEASRGVSVADIGAHTGLAASTVSLALRGAYGVSAQTRARVLSAAAELGYDMRRVDRPAARRTPPPVLQVPPAPQTAPAPAALPAEHVQRLRAGIVYPAGTGIAAVQAMRYHSLVLDGIQAAAGPLQTDLVLLPCLDEDLDPLMQLVADGAGSGKQGAPDGLLMLALGPRSRALHHALRRPAPVVLLNRYDHTLPCSWVTVHHEHMAGELARHVLAQGYRTIAFVGDSTPQPSRQRQRLEGVRKAVQSFAADGAPATFSAWVDRKIGEPVFDDLAALVRGGSPAAPVAIIAHTDSDALDVRAGLRARGLETPDNYGLAGFDDLADGLTGSPNGITTVTYSHEAIGALALRVLRDLREDPLRERQQLFVKATVAVRETTRSAGSSAGG